MTNSDISVLLYLVWLIEQLDITDREDYVVMLEAIPRKLHEL